jgi:hypothetical protein
MKVSSFLAGGVAAALLCASTSHAQQKSAISHGSWLVGGTAAFDHTNSGGSQTSVSLQPFGLYFFADHLGLGGTLDLGYSSLTNAHTTFIGAEPTIRYFFGDPGGKLFPYLNASVGPSWRRFKVEDNSPLGEQTTHGLDFTGSAGLMRLLGTHVGLTGEVYFTHRHRSTDISSSIENATVTGNNDSYGLRFGFNAFVF